MPGGVGGVGGAPGQVAGAGNPVIGGGGVAAGGVAGGAGGNAAGGAAGAGGATRNTNLSALQEIEEAYNKRLDMDVAQLMESFGDIIKTASVSFPFYLPIACFRELVCHSPCFILFACLLYRKCERIGRRGGNKRREE